MSTEKRKSIALLTFISRFSAIDFPVYICDSCAILDSSERYKYEILKLKSLSLKQKPIKIFICVEQYCFLCVFVI